MIYFNDQANYLHPCFEGSLARATDQNKAQFKALLQNMETKGVAKFENAIRKGYETFAKFTEEQKSKISPSRGIMILSDGALSDYADTFGNASDYVGCEF